MNLLSTCRCCGRSSWNLSRDLLQQRFASTRARRRAYGPEPLNAGSVALLAFPGVFFGLGCWQVERLKWKNNLIADIKKNATADPVPLPYDLSELSEMEYRPVQVQGEFDHSREILIHPRTLISPDKPHSKPHVLAFGAQDRNGALVVTPFKLVDRDLEILVNRGWIPNAKLDPKQRREGQIEGPIVVNGLVRKSERPSAFANKGTMGAENRYAFRLIDKMADKASTAPVFIDASFDSTVPGGPIGGQSRLVLRNEHLSYIITWYLLSAITGYLWYSRYIR